jgi:hypothetical protein
MRKRDSQIEEILETSKGMKWETLFTHPKLMSAYYWKDYKIHDKQQRVEEIKKVLKVDSLKKGTHQ